MAERISWIYIYLSSLASGEPSWSWSTGPWWLEVNAGLEIRLPKPRAVARFPVFLNRPRRVLRSLRWWLTADVRSLASGWAPTSRGKRALTITKDSSKIATTSFPSIWAHPKIRLLLSLSMRYWLISCENFCLLTLTLLFYDSRLKEDLKTKLLLSCQT